MEALTELAGFLLPETRLDVKSLALHHVLSMTGDFESRKLLAAHETAIKNVISIAFNKNEEKTTSKDAFLTLINIATDELDARVLIQNNPELVSLLLNYIQDENSKYSDAACAVLSNLSRGKENSESIFMNYFIDSSNDTNNNEKINGKVSLEQLLKVFCTENFNKSNSLDYLGPFICNLTQIESVRNVILNNKIIMLRLLPYINYERSIIRRGGIIGSIKNCCFNYDFHETLLFSPDIDLLSRLLLPLAGPEEFDADDMEKLPDDLQYLPTTKERESDPDIRIILYKILNIQVLYKKKCRDYIKDKNSYIILREFHNSEKDEDVLAVCEKLIQLLISDEPEAGMEDLHQVVVPQHLSNKFFEFEKNELEKNFN